MATPTIPLGFHIWSATFTCVGSTHNNVITCAGKNNAYLTAATLNAQWTAAITNALGPITAAKMGTNYSLVERKVLANIGGVLQNDINTGVIAGTGTMANPPLNTALLIQKITGFAGRPYQARMFCPPFIDESVVDAAGNIGAGQVTAVSGYWNYVNNALATAGIDMVILHDPSTGLIPTKIASFQCRGRLGTIGRRFRR